MSDKKIDFDSERNIGFALSGPEYITIVKDGEEVWRGTPEMWGFFLTAMRGDLIREWRCKEENIRPCPPNSGQEGHESCCWIVYYEMKEPT